MRVNHFCANLTFKPTVETIFRIQQYTGIQVMDYLSYVHLWDHEVFHNI